MPDASGASPGTYTDEMIHWLCVLTCDSWGFETWSLSLTALQEKIAFFVYFDIGIWVHERCAIWRRLVFLTISLFWEIYKHYNFRAIAKRGVLCRGRRLAVATLCAYSAHPVVTKNFGYRFFPVMDLCPPQKSRRTCSTYAETGARVLRMQGG